MGEKWNVTPCAKCPKEVRDELQRYLKDKKQKDNESYKKVRLDLLDNRYNRNNSDKEHVIDEGFEIETSPRRENGKKKVPKGQIDLFFRKP